MEAERDISRVSQPMTLPPIHPSRPGTEMILATAGPGRLVQLEAKVRHLEEANLRLVDIVFKLKDALEATNHEASTKRPPGLPSQSTEVVPYDSAGMSRRLGSLTEEVESLANERARLEATVMRLADEVSRLQGQTAVQAEMVVVSGQQLSSKTQRMRTDYLSNVVCMATDAAAAQLESITDRVARAQESAQKMADCAGQHTDLVETVSEVRAGLRQLAVRIDEITHFNSGSEAALAFRITELAQKLNEERRSREMDTQKLQMVHQDTLHMQESTRMVLENHLSGLLSESQARQMDRETNTRTDLIHKITEFERMLLSEKETRNSREKEIHARISDVSQKSTSYQNEAIEEMRQILQRGLSKTAEAVHQLEAGTRLIELNVDEKLRKHYQITAAEIAARKKLHEAMKSDVQVLEERIRAATAAMQLAISGLANRIPDKSDNEEVKQQTERRIGEFQLYMSRNFADIDSQLQQMAGRVSSINVTVETRISEATSDLASEVRDTLASVLAWQANSTAHLREMQNIRVSIMQELSKMQLTLTHIESEIPTQMTIETDDRVSAIADIRHQMESLKMAMNSQPAIKEVDVDKIQESIRKLAETLQSMRSSVGMKIQSEQEIRIDQIRDLQAEMRYLEEQFLAQKKPQEAIGKRGHFVKPAEEDDAEVEHFEKRLMNWKENAQKNKGKKGGKKPSRFAGLFKKNKK